MYSLETGRDSTVADSGTELKSLGIRMRKVKLEEDGTAQKAFTDIFGGRRKRLNGMREEERCVVRMCMVFVRRGVSKSGVGVLGEGVVWWGNGSI